MQVLDLGRMAYEPTLELQRHWHSQVVRGEADETVLFVEHEPVLTLGRAAKETDVGLWKGPISWVERGGKATYHGPGQLVIYPILDLRRPHKIFPAKDIHGFLRALETWLSNILYVYGLQHQIPQVDLANETAKDSPSRTGVWVKNRKVASIGIAVRQWVSFHGLAINLCKEAESGFTQFNPCGFNADVMTSVESLLRDGNLPSASMTIDLTIDLFNDFKSRMISEIPAIF